MVKFKRVQIQVRMAKNRIRTELSCSSHNVEYEAVKKPRCLVVPSVLATHYVFTVFTTMLQLFANPAFKSTITSKTGLHIIALDSVHGMVSLF